MAGAATGGAAAAGGIMVWPSGMGGAANGGAGNVRGGVGTGETAEISLTALSAMKLWSAMSLPKRSNASPAGGAFDLFGSDIADHSFMAESCLLYTSPSPRDS